MDKDWIKIHTTNDNYKAELLKGLLLENNIEAVIINKKDSSYLFGELELYVNSRDVIKAKHILNTEDKL
jgi:hypothetical protein